MSLVPNFRFNNLPFRSRFRPFKKSVDRAPDLSEPSITETEVEDDDTLPNCEKLYDLARAMRRQNVLSFGLVGCVFGLFLFNIITWVFQSPPTIWFTGPECLPTGQIQTTDKPDE